MIDTTTNRDKVFILCEYKTSLQQGRTKYAQSIRDNNSDLITESEFNTAFDEVVGTWLCKNK